MLLSGIGGLGALLTMQRAATNSSRIWPSALLTSLGFRWSKLGGLHTGLFGPAKLRQKGVRPGWHAHVGAGHARHQVTGGEIAAILEDALKTLPAATPQAIEAHFAKVYAQAIEDGLITPDGLGPEGALDAAA